MKVGLKDGNPFRFNVSSRQNNVKEPSGNDGFSIGECGFSLHRFQVYSNFIAPRYRYPRPPRWELCRLHKPLQTVILEKYQRFWHKSRGVYDFSL